MTVLALGLGQTPAYAFDFFGSDDEKPAPPTAITVRGVRMSLPLELRVLVHELDPNQEIEISGTGLRDSRGNPIADETIRCASRRDPSFLLPMLNASPEGTRGPIWGCFGANYRKVLTGPAEFSPTAGFLKAGHDFYRRALELVPKGDKLYVINDLGMEEYLAGLVNREINSRFPPEAIKAQVIAARSYALATAADRRKAGQFFDLYGTIQDQVYRGSTLEDGKSFRLVRETEGQVLVHRENVLKAYYHASSGGHSELPQSVWPEPSPDTLAYLARPSETDEKLESTKWTIVLSPFVGAQWPGVGKLREIRVLNRSAGRRVQLISLTGEQGSVLLSGPEFRRKLGVNWVKSTYFYVKAIPQGWLLEGRGHGHGVGLSQLGARAMAQEGRSVSDILNFYYPYASVRKLVLDPSSPAFTIGTR